MDKQLRGFAQPVLLPALPPVRPPPLHSHTPRTLLRVLAYPSSSLVNVEPCAQNVLLLRSDAVCCYGRSAALLQLLALVHGVHGTDFYRAA